MAIHKSKQMVRQCIHAFCCTKLGKVSSKPNHTMLQVIWVHVRRPGTS